MPFFCLRSGPMFGVCSGKTERLNVNCSFSLYPESNHSKTFHRRDKESCSKDEAWIANWFCFSHIHVATLLAGMVHVSRGTAKLEMTLCYIVTGIVFIYMAEGIFSINVLNTHLANVQVVIFVLLLIAIAFFTAEAEGNQPLIPLPRKLSTSSFNRRGKLSITTVALGFQFLSSMFRVIEMVLAGGQNGYLGDQSR